MTTKAEIFGPDERRELDRLKRALALGRGPEFHVVVGDTRRVVDAALAEVLPGVEAPQETILPEEPPRAFAVRWLSWLEQAIHTGGDRPVILDAWDVDREHIEHWGWIFARMNERRNEIMRGLGRPLVLLVSPNNETLLGRMAPDLWSIRRAGMRLRDRSKRRATPATRSATRSPASRAPTSTEVAAQRQRTIRARAEGDAITRAIEALRLARRLYESTHVAEASIEADGAVAEYEALASEDPSYDLDLARALRTRAEVGMALGRGSAALADLERSRELLEGLLRADPSRSDVHEDLAEGLDRLGEVLLGSGMTETASTLHERAAALRGHPAASRLAGADPRPSAPRVLIVHGESQEVAGRARQLAHDLREHGIDVRLHEGPLPPWEGRATWTERQLADADVVLVVCPLDGLDGLDGELAERLAIEASARNLKIVPILFDDDGPGHVPRALRSFSHHRITADDDYGPLLRTILRQTRVGSRP